MSDAEPWTLARVARERPELAGLVRLHEALGATGLAYEREQGAFHPRVPGVPAVHWLTGSSLLAAAEGELVLRAAELFVRLAESLAAAFPATSAAAGELRSLARAEDFPWEERVRRARELPEGAPHPELFRFLMLRTLAVPAGHLARSMSPPPPERWRRPACPFCGTPAAASVGRPGAGRTLLCVLCGGRWDTADLGCFACGERRAEGVRVLAAREAGPASLEACATCGAAWKVFSQADLGGGPPLALELLTVHLDVVAARDEGVHRPEAARAALFPPA